MDNTEIDIEKKDYADKKLQAVLDQIKFTYHPDDQTHRTRDIERMIKQEMHNPPKLI